MNENAVYWLNLLFSFFITGLLNCVFPLFIRIAIKKPMENSRAKKYAMINAIIVYLIFTLIGYMIYINSPNIEFELPNIIAAFVWYFAARAILRYGAKSTTQNEYGFEVVMKKTGSIYRKEMSNEQNKKTKGKIYKKCPKCNGFSDETDDYCKTCGYRFIN